MKRLRSLLQKKEGTTLVETMVCLLLISIMLAMAASALSAASRIFVRVQRMQYAQSILDTAMIGIENNYPKCEWVCENL